MKLPLPRLAGPVLAVALFGCGGSSFSSGDAGTGGGGPGGEGGADGGAEACASFCAGKMLAACADFDEQPAGQAPSGWAVAATAGGSAAISSAEALSCANSLGATLPAEGHSGGTAGVSVPITVKGLAPHVVLDFAVWLPTNDTVSYVTFVGLAAGLDGVGFTHHADSSWYLSNKDGSINVQLETAPKTGAWNQMNLDTQFSTTTGSVKLTYEGDDGQPHTATFSGKTVTVPPQTVTAEFGLYAPGQTEAPFSVYFDNIEIQAP